MAYSYKGRTFADPISIVFIKYIENEQLTDQEVSVLEKFVNRSPRSLAFFQEMTDPDELQKQIAVMAEGDRLESWKRIEKKLFPNG